MQPHHMGHDFVNKCKVDLIVLIYLDQAIDHLAEVGTKQAQQLLRLGHPHRLGEELNVVGQKLLIRRR
jgi:hypothetical protein